MIRIFFEKVRKPSNNTVFYLARQNEKSQPPNHKFKRYITWEIPYYFSGSSLSHDSLLSDSHVEYNTVNFNLFQIRQIKVLSSFFFFVFEKPARIYGSGKGAVGVHLINKRLYKTIRFWQVSFLYNYSYKKK